MRTREEIDAEMDALADQGSIDREIYDLRAIVEELLDERAATPVYVQTDDGSAWCARHWALMPDGDKDFCLGFEGGDDPGRCIPMSLYVEAPDP